MIHDAAMALFSLAPLLLPQDAISPAETAEDVEVLEKLLVDALDALQPPQGVAAYKKPDGEQRDDSSYDLRIADDLLSLTMQANGTVRHARSFHLPGTGLFFALDVELPAVAESPKQEASGAPKEEDEWERARRALRGEPSAEVRVHEQASERSLLEVNRVMEILRTVRWVVDEAALERARDVALGVLARHGGRVRGLASEETITIALHVTPSRRGSGSWRIGAFDPSDPLGSALSAREVPLGQFVELPDDASRWARWLSAYGPRSSSPIRFVLHVRVSDLATAAPAADPAAYLRERARVHRY